MFIGISARYKDKRVDKVLRDLGYESYEIFYSPLVVSVSYLLMFLAAVGYLFFVIFYRWPLIVTITVAVYLCIFYLVSAYSNNSLAITEGELVIVNPNYPFRKHSIIPLAGISDVHIGECSPIWRKALTLFVNNYIDLRVGNDITRYYCIGLEPDSFDENLTEKTIEDFQHELEKRDIEVIMADTDK